MSQSDELFPHTVSVDIEEAVASGVVAAFEGHLKTVGLPTCIKLDVKGVAFDENNELKQKINNALKRAYVPARAEDVFWDGTNLMCTIRDVEFNMLEL